MNRFNSPLILTFLFLVCENVEKSPNLNVEEPGQTIVNRENESKEVDFLVYDTKEPYMQIANKMEEAWLVSYGIDQDHQVNGKVALEDLGAVECLPLYYTRDNGEFFITRMKDWLLRTDTTVKGISMPANLTIFKNLKDLRVSFSTVIDIKDLSKLQVLEIGRSPEQITSPPKSVNGDMNLSGSPELRKLTYHGIGKVFNLTRNSNLEELQLLSPDLSVLDLSNNPKLTSVDLEYSKKLEAIYVSEETLKRIQEATSYTDIQKWKKPQDAVWKLKG